MQSIFDLPIDATLYAGFLAASLILGALAARRVKGLADYYVAGAQMPWYLLCGTFIASIVSAGLFLGGTNMTGRHGYTMWCSYFTTSLGYVLAVGVVGVLVKRLAANHRIYDFADILAVRYPSRRTEIRVLTAIVLPIVYIPSLAAQFMALTVLSAAMFNLPYETVLLVVVGIVVAYTVMGGMLGVVWTDTFQFLVLFAGLIFAVPLGMTILGDGDTSLTWEKIVAISPDLFRATTADWSWQDAAGQWVWVFALCAQPHLVTRFLTAKDERTIIKALPLCAVGALVIYATTVPIGLMGQLSMVEGETEQYYYMALAQNTLGPWLGTFVLVGIAAAALSTCSTILMVTAQALSRDVYERLHPGTVTDQRLLRFSRLSVLVIGLTAGILAYFQVLGIFWLIVLSSSLLAAIYFVPLVGGFFSRRATGAGAIAGMVAGAIATVVIFAVNQSTGSHWFVHELFAGLGASLAAWWWVNQRSTPTAEERAALASMAR